MTFEQIRQYIKGVINGIDFNSHISPMPAEDMSEIVTPLPSVMSRRMKYSTEEQVVGEWIDGKPLYQKTFVTTTASNSSEKAVYDVTGLNIIGISQFRLEWQSDSDRGYIWDSRANKESATIDFYTSGNTLYIQVSDPASYDRELIATLQYTKTTD